MQWSLLLGFSRLDGRNTLREEERKDREYGENRKRRFETVDASVAVSIEGGVGCSGADVRIVQGRFEVSVRDEWHPARELDLGLGFHPVRNRRTVLDVREKGSRHGRDQDRPRKRSPQ